MIYFKLVVFFMIYSFIFAIGNPSANLIALLINSLKAYFMIAAGTKVSLSGKKPTLRSSEESQFLYLILCAINNLAAISATGVSANQVQTTGTGATSVVIPAGTWLTSIAAESITNPTETINAGTTSNGTDLINGLAINNTSYKSSSINKYFATQQTIYFSGATGSVNYQLLISKS